MFRLTLLLTIIGTLLAAASPDLMPYPAKVTPGRGFLQVDSSFRISAEGFSDARLEGAIRRANDRILRQTGIVPAVRPEGRPALVVKCRGGGAPWPALGEDESYQLDITDSHALLSAMTVTGALRGLATFIQLITPGPDAFGVPQIHIEDRPRFPWRGLMLDVSRHWMPPEVVLRNLDAMAAVKLNVFHWHLSDDQGFRVESKLFPRLQQAGSDGHFYTQAQAYAGRGGIRPGSRDSRDPGVRYPRTHDKLAYRPAGARERSGTVRTATPVGPL